MCSTLIPEMVVGVRSSARSVLVRSVVLRIVGGRVWVWERSMTERWEWEHTTAMAVPFGVQVV